MALVFDKRESNPAAGHIMRQFATLAASTRLAEHTVSEDNPIRIFVTHNFKESVDYLRVFEFLESVDRFFYLNTAKPENVPESGGLEAIKDELILQIKECEAVIVLASLYSDDVELVSYQMDVAEANEKPIIAIRPFGGMLETPQDLVDRVKEHIEWNEREMADAIRRQARLEDTARWDVVDFP
jgi:hypothetical protein